MSDEIVQGYDGIVDSTGARPQVALPPWTNLAASSRQPLTPAQLAQNPSFSNTPVQGKLDPDTGQLWDLLPQGWDGVVRQPTSSPGFLGGLGEAVAGMPGLKIGAIAGGVGLASGAFGAADASLAGGGEVGSGYASSAPGFQTGASNISGLGNSWTQSGAGGGAGGVNLGSEGLDPVTMGDAVSPWSTNPSTASLGGNVGSASSGFDAAKFFSNPTNLLSGANLISGLVGANAASRAGNIQAGAANNATAAQLAMFNTLQNQGAPYRQAGYNALADLSAGTGTGPATSSMASGSLTRPFGPDDLKTNLAPNYQFMLDQGLGAARNQLNVSGGMGGNTLKGITDYAENYAGNAYQNAFQNYNTNQTNIFNRLSTIAGLGQTANAQSATSTPQLSSGIAGTTQAAGASQAAGLVGSTNAATGGVNNAASWYALPSILNMGKNA